MFVLPDRKTLRNNMMGWHGLPEIYVVESQAICNYWNEWESLKMIISHFYVSTKRDQTKQSPHKTLIKSHPPLLTHWRKNHTAAVALNFETLCILWRAFSPSSSGVELSTNLREFHSALRMPLQNLLKHYAKQGFKHNK